VRFIDSWNFITIPLGKFGTCFGLSQSKTDFPHGFSVREHLAYRGAMPGAETEEDWYSLKHIKGGNAHETTTQRGKMIRDLKQEAPCYVSEHRPDNPVWDYKEQIMKYCWQDVEVLRLGCKRYREMFMTIRQEDAEAATEFGWKPTPVDPFPELDPESGSSSAGPCRKRNGDRSYPLQVCRSSIQDRIVLVIGGAR
jgi:hypothetical protein